MPGFTKSVKPKALHLLHVLLVEDLLYRDELDDPPDLRVERGGLGFL